MQGLGDRNKAFLLIGLEKSTSSRLNALRRHEQTQTNQVQRMSSTVYRTRFRLSLRNCLVNARLLIVCGDKLTSGTFFGASLVTR